MMRDRAVTLIELILVVAIIAVLAAMVIPKLTGRSEEARRVAAQADINSNIAMALDLYELDNGSYPEELDWLLKKPTPEPPNWNGPYLKKKPIDPWGEEYHYKFPGVHNKESYDLWSTGKDRTEGGGDDITNWEKEE